MRVRDGPTHNYIVTKSQEPITSLPGGDRLLYLSEVRHE